MSNCNGHRWSKFWWQDHRNETALRLCSLAARGYWLELLCVAHEATPVGHVLVNGKIPTTRQLAGLAGCTEREARRYEAELEDAGVFSRTPDGVIYSRRMAREGAAEATAAEAWKAYGSNGGNPKIIRGTVAKAERQRPYRRSDSPQKTERIFQRDGGRCHWCQAPLERDNPLHPHFFHVDHIVAVRDGGGVDEENLVAACQSCNMKRARHGDHSPDIPPTETSDSNPPTNPTVTLGSFRQQPYARATEADTYSEPEAEEEEEVSKNNNLFNVFVPPARVPVAQNGHDPSVPASEPDEKPAAKALRIATRNVLGKVTRKLESPTKRRATKRPERSVSEQIDASHEPTPLSQLRPDVQAAILAARRELAERAAQRQEGAS